MNPSDFDSRTMRGLVVTVREEDIVILKLQSGESIRICAKQRSSGQTKLTIDAPKEVRAFRLVDGKVVGPKEGAS